jgi:hypothetical protein
MRTHSHTLSRQPSSGVWSALRRDAEGWWQELPEPLRRPWPMALSMLTILALLAGFHQVVRDSVRQGELLRMSTATRAEAVWRCQALRQPKVRDNCLAQLDSQHQPAVASNRPPPNTATMQVAQR